MLVLIFGIVFTVLLILIAVLLGEIPDELRLAKKDREDDRSGRYNG